MAWNPAPVLLVLYLSTTDWFIGRAMMNTTRQSRRDLWVALSVTNNLLLLGLFKYADWLITSLNDVLAWVGMEIVYPRLGLVLPVGLSFVVFQCMSYTIDVYRGDIKARKSWLDVSLYIAFFPQVVAGPIVRAADFLPQLDRRPSLSDSDGSKALLRIALGMVKKLVIADYLAANLISRVFSDPENYSAPEVVTAVFAYTLQIYYDFSAYSDIAIGVAALFGFSLRENFDKPYLATNLFEFWRRWHISLGRWLFDYLYRPLGGNRKGKLSTLWNLWVVMLLGSVWHGADWRFVVWGFIHGIVLLGNRVMWWTLGKPDPNRSWTQKVIPWCLTFLIVMEARIVFNAENMSVAWRVFLAQFSEHMSVAQLRWELCAVLFAAIAGHIITHQFYASFASWFSGDSIQLSTHGKALPGLSWPLRAIFLLGVALGIKHAMNFEVQPFIYFQF